MSNSEFSAVPLPIRLQAYTKLLEIYWVTYLENLLPDMFGGAYPRAQLAEMLLNAIGIGAGRWVREPKARPPRPLSVKKQMERWYALRDDERDHVGLHMTDSLAELVQKNFADAVEQVAIDADTRSVLVPLQISGLRAGAAQVLSPVFKKSTTLATLDGVLREHLPAEISWWDLDEEIAALLLGS